MVPVCSSHLWTCWLLFPCPFTVHDDFFSQITFLPYFLVIGCTGATGGKVWNTSDASTVFRAWSGKKHSNWNLQHLGTIQSCTCCISCLYFRLNSTALRYCQGRDQKGEGSERQNKGTFRKLCTNGLNQRVIQFRGMEGHEVSCFLGKGSVELSKKKKRKFKDEHIFWHNVTEAQDDGYKKQPTQSDIVSYFKENNMLHHPCLTVILQATPTAGSANNGTFFFVFGTFLGIFKMI